MTVLNMLKAVNTLSPGANLWGGNTTLTNQGTAALTNVNGIGGINS